jgi:hypothetical protein
VVEFADFHELFGGGLDHWQLQTRANSTALMPYDLSTRTDFYAALPQRCTTGD